MRNQNRRTALKNILAGSAAIGASGVLTSFTPVDQNAKLELKGNINHAVCRWCYADLSVEQLCKEAKRIGIKGIDLIGPKDWPTLKEFGLYSSMCNGAEINLIDGW